MKNKSLTQLKCRVEARAILKEFLVESPDEIDLEVIAWHSCRLHLEFGGLDSAEGRLIARPPSGGIIRINDKLSSRRTRFTIAHEIGHFRIHGAQMCSDSSQDLATWGGNSIEVEANYFAAELLMPEFLFSKEVNGIRPSWGKVKSISDKYNTSRYATAIQMIEYTNEPCALVCSTCGIIHWVKVSSSFRELGFFIGSGNPLNEYTGAYEIFSKKSDELSIPSSLSISE